jgi:SAM-dependent methyltransferase
MHTIQKMFPRWREYRIHEASPGWDAASMKIRKGCREFVASQYDRSMPWGSFNEVKGYYAQDLEAQTFEDRSFDLVITQDVFEHLFHPDRAIREIARTLRPGGAHVCIFPIVRKAQPSRRRASIENGEIKHLFPPEYHSDAVLGANQSLVTIDWGYDVGAYLNYHSGLATTLIQIDNIDLGIRAELSEVVVSIKPEAGNNAL